MSIRIVVSRCRCLFPGGSLGTKFLGVPWEVPIYSLTRIKRETAFTVLACALALTGSSRQRYSLHFAVAGGARS